MPSHFHSKLCDCSAGGASAATASIGARLAGMGSPPRDTREVRVARMDGVRAMGFHGQSSMTDKKRAGDQFVAPPFRAVFRRGITGRKPGATISSRCAERLRAHRPLEASKQLGGDVLLTMDAG